MPRGIAVGVTGGIGCGKSEVGKALSDLGVEVLEADELARARMEAGEPVKMAKLPRGESLAEMLGSERLDGRRFLDIGSGSGDLTKRLPSDGEDEVAQIARSFMRLPTSSRR